MESNIKGCEDVKEECLNSDEEPFQGDEMAPGHDSSYEEGECPSRTQENSELSDDEWKPVVKKVKNVVKRRQNKKPS